LVFSPIQYLDIHKKLFKNVFPHAGKIRTYNISKKEWVLNGDTVIYGGASMLKETLEYDFSVEKNYDYFNI
jgi:fido (protein-threonine AMPylation protein)